MNPDIQRIAEKWASMPHTAEPFWLIDRFTAALTELSALRDTQERELRERLPADWFEDASLETWFPLTAETLKEQEETIASLRAELARRDEVEKELRHSIWQKDKAIELLYETVNEGITQEVSLRSRIGELETMLSEKT